ncbi:Hypothetical protein R9X50_00462100 [Acrodontium crateriforme]|uniref:Uncharacterized protein n=1 Tax=Acrodontium crateriforme TaxID=150365 RepID=A0AAQ3R8I6_9PEZI|nr:Hypothetical protein R9X50_00462100 [Acrodontium crateriforme]
MAPWQQLNSTAPLPAEGATAFTITTAPQKDIWRASPTWNVFDAPMIYQKIKKSKFKSFRVTVTGPWKTLFDQGGFLLAFPVQTKLANESKWIKAGIEFFKGQPKVGVVGTDTFSDWSLYPLSEGSGNEGTFEAVLEDGSLWIYLVAKDGERHPLREVRWAFQEGDDDDAEMWVGAYAAKPTREADGSDEGIEVEFKDFKLETCG